MKTKTVLTLFMLSLICGSVGLAINWLDDITFDNFIASGLSPLLYDLLFGGTILAAPVVKNRLSFLGSAILASVISAVIEFIVGHDWNLFSLYAALIPGISYEVAFLPQRFLKRWPSLLVGGLLTTISTIIWDWFRNGYNQIPAQQFVLLCLIRFVSMLIITQFMIGLFNHPKQSSLEERHV